MVLCGGLTLAKPWSSEAPFDISIHFDTIYEKAVAANIIEISQDGNDDDKYSQFKPLHYKTQVVAGTNYFVSLKITADKAIAVRFFRPLPHTGQGLQVVSVKEMGDINDEVQYFEAGC